MIVSDFLTLNSVSTSQEAHVGTWWFETVLVGTEWDPALFTKMLNDCRERLQHTLDNSSIFSYVCREHSTVLVPGGQVAIKGFLKMQCTYKVRLGILQRRLLHATIISNMNWIIWIPVEVGQGKHCTADQRIQNFIQQTALPPEGVLQQSNSVCQHRYPCTERHASDC